MPLILHFGIGNFHRAHQAWYTAQAGDGWSIVGVSLRRPETRDLLVGQGYTYTLAVRGAGATDYTRIEVIKEILVAPETPARVLAQICDPDVKVVTLTVTEKGYNLTPQGRLDLSDPAIIRDIAHDIPRTTIGFLARGLAQRAKGGAPLTVLSCDNLSGNGQKLHAAIVAFADAAGIDRPGPEITFPDSMVDRITPATTEALVAEVLVATGERDAAPVETELFSDWVIEDRFAAERPAWERGGARFVADVAPFETRKLRMLNGSHSLIAYLGQLRGHEFVHQAIQDPVVAGAAARLMEEAALTLPSATRKDAPEYARALLARFSNPALHHRLAQIAMDGSLKVPVRICRCSVSCMNSTIRHPGL